MTCDDDRDPEECEEPVEEEGVVIEESNRPELTHTKAGLNRLNKRPKHVNMSQAKNGYIVRCEMNTAWDEYTYVFSTLEEALNHVKEYFENE